MKNMLKVRILGSIIFIALLVLFPIVSHAATNVTILGGPVGGGWYMICGGLAEIVQSVYPELLVKVVPGGGLVNPPRVSTGDADFALSLPVNTEMAFKGVDPYEKKYQNTRVVAAGFNMTYYQVVARSEVPLNSFAEIFKKKYPIKLTTPGLQTMGGWTVKKLFGYYGAKIDDLKNWGGAHYVANHSRQADLMRDGQANVLMTLLQLPAPNILEIATVRKLKFLPFSEELIKKFIKEYGYGSGDIPKGSYKDLIQIQSAIPTLTLASSLIVNKDVPDDIVYKFTKALFEKAEKVQKIHKSMKDFIPEEIVKEKYRGNIKLHPGAEKYFKEKGYNYR